MVACRHALYEIGTVRRVTRTRRGEELPVFYWFLKYVGLGPLLRLFFRPKVEGVEHIPADRAAILASNHLSFCDSVFLPLVVPRRVTFLAKSEYFTGRGLKGTLVRWFMSGIGQLPINRTDASAA